MIFGAASVYDREAFILVVERSWMKKGLILHTRTGELQRSPMNVTPLFVERVQRQAVHSIEQLLLESAKSPDCKRSVAVPEPH